MTMGALAQIALGVLAISFMTFVAFFGRLPALRHTPIAWMHRAIWVYIPNAILGLDQRLTSGRLTTGLGRFGTYIMYDRHPTVLIFFILLLSIGEYMYLPGVWPHLSIFHKLLGSISIILPYLFLYLAAAGDPGIINTATHSRYMSHYPYDFSIFHPGQVCRTCGLLKPPRSKHCSVCKRCVHRMDHHCVFINNCVGYGNQHYFLLLLLSTAFLTSYGGALGLVCVADSARAHNKSFTLFPKPTGWSWAEYLLLLTMGIQEDAGVGAVTLLAIMTSPLVWGLLGYHAYLIYCGTTTNESMKWQDWQMEMDDGCVFKRSLAPDRVKDPRNEAPWTRWPLDPIQVLIRTEDGAPPSADGGPGIGEWERVWRLRDVENLYDLGFWDNLIDVFVPNYPFRGADTMPTSTADLERGGKRRTKKPPRAPRASSLVAAAT
ncbi:zf-DHHC-domain-containing protein [Hypoxylon trugodes]|uniref:zf-DHHC-domain-containing protein n=1 Tax=Hypoxylon trugodes TaxID=326681 RepID=UPI00218F4C2D|nr:zf-DHHC-domain-containing protein [Hypoxylon trugodes]KAI1387207.1 zf-DHHC-domain-containing protein [Hypoxylon trugodes]